MIFIGQDKTIDFENFKYFTTFYQNTPSQEQRNYRVIGRDEDVIFTNGLTNKRLQINLLPIDTNIQNRMSMYRELKSEFLKGGHIILDQENDVKYKCKLLNGTNIRYSGNYDTISVTFDLSPTALRSYDPETLTWETAAVSWNLADFNWDQTEFTIPSDTGTFTLTNKGNIVSKPLFVIDGNVVITCNGKSFEIINNIQEITLSVGDPPLFFAERIYVDTDKMIVYNGSKENVINRFVGDFINFEPGENEVSIVAEDGSSLAMLQNVSRWV